jgi:hypothetical protein
MDAETGQPGHDEPVVAAVRSRSLKGVNKTWRWDRPYLLFEKAQRIWLIVLGAVAPLRVKAQGQPMDGERDLLRVSRLPEIQEAAITKGADEFW